MRRAIDVIREVDGEMEVLARALPHSPAPTPAPVTPPQETRTKDTATMTDSLPRPHKRNVLTRAQLADTLYVVKETKPRYLAH